MTAILERPGDRVLERLGPVRILPWLHQHAAVVLALGVVALRLPAVAAAPGADEAGFLTVAAQWHSGGTSLYGSYWVDRPPLLVSIFRVAAQLGGVVPLRIIGALAAALVVLGTARLARQLVPAAQARLAATGAAVVAAAFCVSPLMGTTEVNGELLAAPFVVGGMSAFVAALRHGDRLIARSGQVLAAGACFAAAVLVKQNFLDVGVFAAAALLIGVLRREVSPGRAARVAVGFAAGAVLATGLVAGWTLVHGTSLRGVYDAMYPFRLAAARALAASGNPAPQARLAGMLSALALTVAPVVVALAGWALGTRRVRGTFVWAIAAMLAFDAASVLLGGNYWSHYLVQLLVPVSVLAGVLVASRQRGMVAVVVAVALSGVAAWGIHPAHHVSPGSSLGHAISEVAQPGDTLVTVYGHADVGLAAGLPSPYPYLWSLPLKVRDPREQLLDHVLAGPDAPTWFVTWAHVTSLGVDATGTQRLLSADYHPVAVIDGHTVYLHNGVGRADPATTIPRSTS